ncbi:hypothetical protein D8Y20_05900 [Mariprofundus sp. EBB-1]|nr:hypothetical protein D8Y20_05900 [Mariprofundus sp. EBB-1]
MRLKLPFTDKNGISSQTTLSTVDDAYKHLASANNLTKKYRCRAFDGSFMQHSHKQATQVSPR